MASDDREIVSALQSALADRLGKDRYDIWFGEGVQFTASGGVLQLSAPDAFSIERLRTRLRDDIAAAARAVFGHLAGIEFRIAALRAEGEAPVAAAAAVSAKESPAEVERPSRGEAAGGQARRRRKFAALGSFVVGPCNRIAHTASCDAAANPGAVSPLFVHGPTGCGKTHLLQGVWSAVRRRTRAARCVYLTAEQFTSFFLEALRGSGLPMFRRKYRDVDALLIDDVQFFEGKRATLMELQHTVDAVLADGGQLVLAADRPPTELRGIGAELAARFSAGLVCPVQPADRDTRLKILQRLVNVRGLSVPAAVLELIADELEGDARHLSGALNRAAAVEAATGQAATVETARAALEDLLSANRRAVRLADIDRAVCDVFGLESSCLKSNRRAKDVSHPRMLAMWLARKHTRSAFSEIGGYFGGRRHSTVISAQKKVTSWVASGAPIELAHGACKVEDALRRIEAKLRTA